ncbi:MAG: hypothetical protein NVSMB16_09960 [Acidimicrobiales bacterium]
MRGLLVTVGSGCWAVQLERAQEVLSCPPLTRLPLTPEAILGVCNRRGDVLPVVSLPAAWGLAPVTPEERRARWVVVVDTHFGAAGVALTTVPSTIELGDAVGSGEGLGVVALYRMSAQSDGPPVALLDLAQILTPARLGATP